MVGTLVVVTWPQSWPRISSIVSGLLYTCLAVAFPACCVWLAVRIAYRRERWAKRTLVLIIGLPIVYVLSYAPMQVLEVAVGSPEWLVAAGELFYIPMSWFLQHCPEYVGDCLADYCDWWMGVASKL